MESAEFAVAVRFPGFAVPHPHLRRHGRFSDGIEHLPETASKQRVGRFGDGLEQISESPDRLLVGRFSTGVEQNPGQPMWVGSFADGYELIPGQGVVAER